MKHTESIYKIADDKRIKVVSKAKTKLVHILKKKPLLQNLFNVKIMLSKRCSKVQKNEYFIPIQMYSM